VLFVDEKVWNSLELIDTGKDLLNWTLIAQALRPIMNSMGQHETENLFMAKEYQEK